MGSRTITECGSCGAGNLDRVLSLPPTPPTCAMLLVGDTAVQQRYPLELLRCAKCTLVQLSCVVDPEEVFPADYPYSSGNSGALRSHFKALADTLHVAPDDLVVDLGGNDGTFLSNLQCRRLSVDPTDQVLKGERHSVSTAQGFFGLSMAVQIRDMFGPARYVTALNVLAHVADPHDFLEGVHYLLDDDGRFITENGDLTAILNGGWDFIYHEHLRYFTPTSLDGLLVQHGLVPRHREYLPIHGGSFRTVCQPNGVGRVGDCSADKEWWVEFQQLRKDVKRNRWQVHSLVDKLVSNGGRVGAIGATARATTLAAAYGLDADLVEAVYEVSTSDKLGHYIPGTRIPVVDESQLYENPPESVLLLLWYMEDLLVPKLRANGYEGDIVVPLPGSSPKVLQNVKERV